MPPKHHKQNQPLTDLFAAVPDRAFRDPRLSKAACAVIGNLNSWWRTTRSAYPSIQTLANDTGFSRSTIIRAVQKLKETGWITQKLAHDHNGLITGAQYFPGPNFTQFPVVASTLPRSADATQRDQGGKNETTNLNDLHHSDRWTHHDGSPKSGPPNHMTRKTRIRDG